eukprot:TRINITY_DN7069_c1_g1_i2.p1 TRINITY_DN7069_c1_g1~~TRINITY_DN7069_c1_g1_i2.p1  ORF type:complete len:444 (-),score=39.96 TRINITY_DN7069_c1_g1_i2:2573-3904(-)
MTFQIMVLNDSSIFCLLIVIVVVVLVSDCNGQVPILNIDRARLIKDQSRDMWETFHSDVEIYVRCSADGGDSWPIRIDLESVDTVGVWYDGPWKLADWEYEYGSMLYCQVLESDQTLPTFLSFLDNLIDPDDYVGDTMIFMSDFVREVTKNVSFYWREEVVNVDRFPKSMEMEISCIGCQGLKYLLPRYWTLPGSKWPEKVESKCRFVQGVRAARLLSRGYCCMAGNFLLIGDGYCSDLYPYKTEACGYDFGDCCPPEQRDCWTIEGYNLSSSNPNIGSFFDFRQLSKDVPTIEESRENEQQCTSLNQFALLTEDVTTFVKALEVTGLSDQIVGPLNGNVTLLAPTNKAFDLITNEYQLSQEDLFDLQSNINVIKEVLEVHIIPEAITLLGRQNLTNILGVNLVIENQQIETEDNQSANILPPEEPISVCEGFLLIIDQVFIP